MIPHITYESIPIQPFSSKEILLKQGIFYICHIILIGFILPYFSPEGIPTWISYLNYLKSLLKVYFLPLTVAFVITVNLDIYRYRINDVLFKRVYNFLYYFLIACLLIATFIFMIIAGYFGFSIVFVVPPMWLIQSLFIIFS